MCCVLEGARLWPAAEERWGSRGYLERALAGVRCHVLGCRIDQRRFSYLFDARQMGRVDGGYTKTEPLVRAAEMSIGEFFRRSARRDECLYLQHSLLQDGGAGVAPCAGLGPQMLQDIGGGLNRPLLDACAVAGRFGSWVRCQLFVGAEAAVGARSILHFDQYDNLFLQISGTKRFRIFDPSQSACLYPYPVHHPLDTRSQIDLEGIAGPDGKPGKDGSWRAGTSAGFPRAGNAAGVELLLRPGEVLFLPAYWWHEVTTLEPTHGDTGGGLCVSVNFWFSAARMLLHPDFPLWPAMRLELARQLEYLISDSLSDRAQHVPSFFRAVDRQLRQPCGAPAGTHGGCAWPALQAERPADVAPGDWGGLFEFVVWKACLLLGPRGVGPFFQEFCDPGRFVGLCGSAADG
jgi:hypoxia-inducible factor 1-alpha inhibitor (HIF hydroxylase)